MVFTKTCARDARRVWYQHHALLRVGALAPGEMHTIWIERADLDKVPQLRELPRETARIEVVEDVAPEAMRISLPYLRQQYCKLLAPTMLGSQLELDSDMIPRREPPASFVQCEWHYRSAGIKPPLDSLLADWQRLWRGWTGDTPPPFSYMLEQHGWYMRPSSCHHFLAWLGSLAGARPPASYLYAGALHLFECLSRGWGRFSEYQFFGWWAAGIGNRGDYTFIDVTRPVPPVSLKDWVLHATSAEPLTPQLEEEMRGLAGGVSWPL